MRANFARNFLQEQQIGHELVISYCAGVGGAGELLGPGDKW